MRRHLFLAFSPLSLVLFTLTAQMSYAQTDENDYRSSAQISFDERLKNLESRVNNGAAMVKMLQQLETLQRENLQLQDRIDKLGYRLEQSEERQKSYFTDNEKRLILLEERLAVAENKLKVLTSGNVTQTPVQAIPGSTNEVRVNPSLNTTTPAPLVQQDTEGREAYGAAFKLLLSSKYDEAIVALRAFIQDYPQSANQAKARYWLAETLYTRRDFQGAIDTFQSLIAAYPDDAKHPDALYKIGLSQLEMGQKEVGLANLKKVMDTFPRSAAASLADKKLKETSQ